MSLSIVLATGLAGFLGNLLDSFLKIKFPLFTLIGIFAGLTAGVIRLLRELNRK